MFRRFPYTSCLIREAMPGDLPFNVARRTLGVSRKLMRAWIEGRKLIPQGRILDFAEVLAIEPNMLAIFWHADKHPSRPSIWGDAMDRQRLMLGALSSDG